MIEPFQFNEGRDSLRLRTDRLETLHGLSQTYQRIRRMSAAHRIVDTRIVKRVFSEHEDDAPVRSANYNNEDTWRELRVVGGPWETVGPYPRVMFCRHEVKKDRWSIDFEYGRDDEPVEFQPWMVDVHAILSRRYDQWMRLSRLRNAIRYKLTEALRAKLPAADLEHWEFASVIVGEHVYPFIHPPMGRDFSVRWEAFAGNYLVSDGDAYVDGGAW